MTNIDILDRDERASALDRFARADEGRASREVTIPQQAFSLTGDQIVGAQKVAVYRDESHVLAKLKSLAAAAGTEWFYRYPVQNKKESRTDWIEGPSVKLANDLARVYGNCSVDVRVMDLGNEWMFYARFVDYETGFSLTRPFQQRKNASKMGGADEGRRLDIALQIGASKAIRNVVVNALQTFSDFAFDEARGALVDKIGQKMEHYRGRVGERLKEMQIDPKRVELIRGRKLADWLAPDIARTIAEIQAVQDGMASADETWPVPSAPEPEAQPSKATKEPGKSSLDEFAVADTQQAPQSADPAPAADGLAEAPEPASEAATGQDGGSDIEAAERAGEQAFRDGFSRKATPPEWRKAEFSDLLAAWRRGYDRAEGDKAKAEAGADG
jgi:hypothetical protein